MTATEAVDKTLCGVLALNPCGFFVLWGRYPQAAKNRKANYRTNHRLEPKPHPLSRYPQPAPPKGRAVPTFIDPTPPSPPPGTPNPPSTADILRTAGHMGIGSAAGRAFAASLLAAAALARTKGAELSARMRAEAHEIQGVYTRTGELGTEHWASEAGRAFRKQLERHRDSIRDRAQIAENTAADIAAAAEELAAELTAKAQGITAAAAALDNLLGSLADTAADILDPGKLEDLVARHTGSAQHELDALMHVSLPEGLNALVNRQTGH